MARVSKGKRKYLVRVYRTLMHLHSFRGIFGQPILTYPQLKELNTKWDNIQRQLNENAKKLMEGMCISESYCTAEVPVRRQRVIEVDKSTGLPRGELPMVTLFTEKGPVND